MENVLTRSNKNHSSNTKHIHRAISLSLTHTNTNIRSVRLHLVDRNMDALQAIATSIGVIGLVLLMVLLVLHFFGPKTAAWIHSNREEKIGFSKNRIYNANGYLVSYQLILFTKCIYGACVCVGFCVLK